MSSVTPLPASRPRLDRRQWETPVVSIVVTHFNYSAHVEDALLSVLDQTHSNWECVVVDDASDGHHVREVEAILSRISHPQVKPLKLDRNVGQTGAFFAGLDATSGEFVCLLDPDDRYEIDFLAEMVKAHLNQTIICPIVSCEQRYLKNGSVIGNVYRSIAACMTRTALCSHLVSVSPHADRGSYPATTEKIVPPKRTSVRRCA